ncbi:MAG: hypothetical protein ACJ76H_15885 [Bacteriovoracaceae bacterium]
MEQRWNYYQYRKLHDYPIYVRVNADEISPKFVHLLVEMGLSLLTETEVKKISLQKAHSRVLTVQSASPRIERQISGSDLLDKYGLESVSIMNGLPVYTYRRVGLLAMPFGRNLWDLAVSSEISHTDQMVGLRVVLARFLAMALADMGVLCYWGTVKDGAVILMKQSQSFGESVLIDVDRRTIFSQGGEMRIGNNLRIVRRDVEGRHSGHISREEIISSLSVNSCLLSFTGITPAMKRSIYSMSSFVTASYSPVEALNP